MSRLTPARIDHLARLTDPRGLMHAARGDQPDRFAGYDTLENADALRLCAIASDGIDAQEFCRLAEIYYGYLKRARGENACVRHGCDAKGRWHESGDDGLVQSRLALTLSAVIVSELPIKMRLEAADWWQNLARQCDQAWSPVVAANWLAAFGQLHAADPGLDRARVESLADWLLDDCFYASRDARWEWFEGRWSPGAARIPLALWRASEVLQDERYAKVARVTTRFVQNSFFEDGLFIPAGNRADWTPTHERGLWDQCPAEVCSVVELFSTARDVDAMPVWGEHAEYAARWFEGNNVKGLTVIDPATGACHDAITDAGLNPNQGASATVSYLLTHAALAREPVTIEETTIYAVSP